MEREAQNLLFFVKVYRHSELPGYYDPQVICNVCRDEMESGKDRLFDRKPKVIPFLQLGRSEMGRVMYLCSDKGKEVNELAEGIWRKKILRVKKIYEGRIRSVVYWPMAL